MNCGNSALKQECEAYLKRGVQVATVTRQGCVDYYITGVPREGTPVGALFSDAAALIRELGASIVSFEVFGLPGSDHAALREAFGDGAWPVLWVEEGCGRDNPLCGIQIWAVAGPTVRPVLVEGRCAGTEFEADGVRYCRLGGILPADITQSRADQTEAVFAQMERALESVGMDFSHVWRTWFYNYHMLEWYGEFNVVRTAYFKAHRVFDGLVPASTGIGGRNAAGAALTAGLIAAKAVTAPLAPEAIPSPLQCPALNYGSSFSRAVEVETGGVRRLFISGTASIEPGGLSVHIGDVDAQVDLTMDVAGAILESRGMGWHNVSRAIAYFKIGEDKPAFDRCCAARGINGFPVLYTNNDICRDDLLFEIEVDAVSKDPVS